MAWYDNIRIHYEDRKDEIAELLLSQGLELLEENPYQNISPEKLEARSHQEGFVISIHPTSLNIKPIINFQNILQVRIKATEEYVEFIRDKYLYRLYFKPYQKSN